MKKLLKTLNIFSFVAIAFSVYGQQDALFSKQWYLQNNGQEIFEPTGDLTRHYKQGISKLDINQTAVKRSKSSKDIVLAVIDSGVDIHHPDLKENIWFNERVCGNMQESDYINAPCFGWNFVDNNSSLIDNIGHGTHVAGIIAAQANNGIGIQGVVPQGVKIMPVKVFDTSIKNFKHNDTYITDIFADGIRFAVGHGADVINLSLGWYKVIETPKIKIAMAKALEKGIPIIAAAGNNGKDIPTFPCTHKGVICVGSHDNRGVLSFNSNFGGKIDLLAPGESIISTFPENLRSRSLRIPKYEKKKGTSQASPIVASIVAALKLQNPDITLDHIKAQLYSNAIKTDGALFGRVNMKRSLENKVDLFVAPIFKETLDLQINKNGRFMFKLPIKSYIGDLTTKVNVSIDHPAVTLTQQEFDLRVQSGREQNILVTGQVNDLQTESHTTLKVQFNNQTYQTLVVINRKIEHATPSQTYSLAKVPAPYIAYFNEKDKGSRLINIIDENSHKLPEFYYFSQYENNHFKRNIISILKISPKTNEIEKFEYQQKDGNTILSIIKRDINFDGDVDYMIYSKHVEDETIHFSFLDSSFKPLFGKHSLWTLPITTFGGLPESPVEEKFTWIRNDHPQLGSIIVPTFSRLGTLPEKDNSDDFLDFIEQQNVYQFYLNPVIKKDHVEIELRVLDSYTFIESIRTKFDLFPDETYSLSLPIKQRASDLQAGQLQYNLAVGQEAAKRNFMITFHNTKKWTIKSFDNRSLSLEQSNIFPILQVTDSRSDLSDQIKYVSLLDRQKMRVARLDRNNFELDSYIFKSQSWFDPIFNFVTSSNDQKNNRVDFIETRKYIYAVENDHTSSMGKLPLYRESSLPILSFAELYTKVFIDQSPGLFIDSTLVYGDRNYVMMWDLKNKRFYRPIKLSFIIPHECISLGAYSVKSQSKLIFQCFDRKTRTMDLKFYPLTLD